MTVVYPDELPVSSYGMPAGISAATQRMMRANGIDPDSQPLASRRTSQLRYAHIQADRLGPGADGAMHRQHLDASTLGLHDDIKNLFQTAEHKLAQVEMQHNRKSGSLLYTDKRLGSSSAGAPSAPAVFRPALAAPPGLTSGGVPAADDECAFPHAEGTLRPPRTAEELAEMLARLKPGKKILKVAGDIEIKETFVTEVIVERKERQPVLVVLCHPQLPSQRSIQGNPRLAGMWRIGTRTSTTQVLVLRCTKEVDIHIHFQLEVAVDL